MKSSGVDDRPTATLTIGELASRFGLAPHVLRHWEAMGLLTPAERVNGRRRYGRAHLIRVGLILRGKQLGMSLAEIRDMLTASDGRGRRAVLHSHLATLERRIAEMQVSKTLVEHVLSCRYEDFTECPQVQTASLAMGGRRDLPVLTPAAEDA
jgi:MerR family transcriptional regulator, copper efflux regulator